MLTKKSNSVNETKGKNILPDSSTNPVKTAKTQKILSPSCNISQTNTNKSNSSLADSTLKKASSTTTNQTYTFQDFYKKNDSKNDNKNTKTKIILKCDIGYQNQLFIRGQGANLSWKKGELLKNIKADEWVWETSASFSECEFKVLLNDTIYEIGENHQIHEGANTSY
jgi:hypothetical protein